MTVDLHKWILACVFFCLCINNFQPPYLYDEKEEGKYSNTAEHSWWGTWDCVWDWGQQQPAVMSGFPVFSVFLLLRPDAWISHATARVERHLQCTCVLGRGLFQSTENKQDAITRNPDGGGVVLCVHFDSQLADSVFLVDLFLSSRSHPFHLSQTNDKEKLFLLLK